MCPVTENEAQMLDLHRIGVIAADSASLSQRFEHLLAPWVNYFILPLFALVNAGVQITSAADLNLFGTTQGMGILFGLWIGKPLGITLLSLLFVKTGLAVMPAGASWKMFAAVACMGGIGFTMSIFMDTLAFASQPQFISTGKIAVLAASVVASVTGLAAVWACTGRRGANRAPLRMWNHRKMAQADKFRDGAACFWTKIIKFAFRGCNPAGLQFRNLTK